MLTLPLRLVRLALSEIAAGSNLAEEVISTVRTSQAFGTQRTLAAVYDTFAAKITVLENKMAIVRCLALGVMFFILYASTYFDRSHLLSAP